MTYRQQPDRLCDQVAGRNKGLKTIAHNRYRPPNAFARNYLRSHDWLDNSLLKNVNEVTESMPFKAGKETSNQAYEQYKNNLDSSGP